MTEPLYPFFYDSFSFYTLKPNISFPFNAFYKPFTNSVWGAILFTYIFITFAFWIISEYAVDIPDSVPVKSFTTNESLMYIIQLSLEQSPMSYHRPYVLKSALFAVLFSILVLSAAYKGKITSFLTSPMFSFIPTTFEELHNSDYKWVVYDDLLQQVATGKDRLKSYSTLVKEDRIQLLSTGAFGCLSLQPDSACVGWNYESESWVAMEFIDEDGRPLLQRSQDDILITGLSGAMVKGSPHRKVINTAIMKMLESGLSLKWIEVMKKNFTDRGKIHAKHMKLAAQNNSDFKPIIHYNNDISTASDSFDFQKCTRTFFLFLCGTIFSVIALIGERQWFKTINRDYLKKSDEDEVSCHCEYYRGCYWYCYCQDDILINKV